MWIQNSHSLPLGLHEKITSNFSKSYSILFSSILLHIKHMQLIFPTLIIRGFRRIYAKHPIVTWIQFQHRMVLNDSHTFYRSCEQYCSKLRTNWDLCSFTTYIIQRIVRNPCRRETTYRPHFQELTRVKGQEGFLALEGGTNDLCWNLSVELPLFAA